MRLVALPVPEDVANQRRYRAKISAQRRHRSPPGKEHLFLMGWNLFLTNVPASIWPPKALLVVYRLRWRIEIIFKTRKSPWGCANSTAARLGYARESPGQIVRRSRRWRATIAAAALMATWALADSARNPWTQAQRPCFRHLLSMREFSDMYGFTDT